MKGASPHHSKARVYAALLLMSFVASAGITVIYGMLTTLYRHFPGSSEIGWVVTIYWLASAIAAAVCGRFGDLFGRRRMTLIVLMLCAVGATMSALSSNLAWLIAGCALQGLASALTPLSFGIVRETMPAEDVPFVVGILGAAGMISAGAIYLMSGAVIDHFSWQGGFSFKVALAIITFVVVLVCVPESRPEPGERIDLVYGLLFVPALCGILIAVQKGREWGWDTRVWGAMAASLVVLALWARLQWRQKTPLIDMRLLGRRQIILANVCMMCVALGSVQIGQVLSLFLQQPSWTHTGFGLSATTAGLVMLTLNIFSLIGSPWSGRIAARQGGRRAALIGFAITTAAWSAMLVWHDRFEFVVAGAIASTIGYAFLQPAVYNLVIEATPTARTAEATGMTYVFFASFFGIGAQLIFALLATSSVSGAAHGPASFPADAAYAKVFGYVALSCIVGFLIALSLPRRREPAESVAELAAAQAAVR